MNSRNSQLAALAVLRVRTLDQEKPWQGGPPKTTRWSEAGFKGSRAEDGSVRISLAKRRVCGWFAAYVSVACGSDSTAKTTDRPAFLAPRLIPPAPAKRSTPRSVSWRVMDEVRGSAARYAAGDVNAARSPRSAPAAAHPPGCSAWSSSPHDTRTRKSAAPSTASGPAPSTVPTTSRGR